MPGSEEMANGILAVWSVRFSSRLYSKNPASLAPSCGAPT
jgi:hypothetical protein